MAKKNYSGMGASELEAERKRLKKVIADRKARGLSAPDAEENLSAVKAALGGSSSSSTSAATTPTPEVVQAGTDTKTILDQADDYGQKWVQDFQAKYPTAFSPISTGTTGEMRSYLDRLNQGAAEAGNYTGLESEAIDRMRAGLGGYDSPEVQAMRESASQELDRNLQTALYNQMKVNAARGVRGGAAGAFASDLGIGAQQSKANIERDLIVKNADEVQKRRSAFADLIRGTEDARFTRKSGAESLYGNALGAEESNQAMKETYNSGQATNRALFETGLGQAQAGTYAGALGATQGANQAQDELSWMKDFLQKSKDEELALLNKYGSRLSSGGSTAI